MKFEVSIEKTLAGKGVLAKKDFAKGEYLFPLKGNIVNCASKYTIQLNKHQHIEPDFRGGAFWQFINHCCEPNAAVNTEKRIFTAIRDIRAGEEITFHYLTTEHELSDPFLCCCKSKKCTGFVRGYRFLNEEDIQRLQPCLSPFLQNFGKIPLNF